MQQLQRTILHDEQLEETNDADDLNEAKGGDSIRTDDGGDAIGVRIE